jgi:hypothetical protein
MFGCLYRVYHLDLLSLNRLAELAGLESRK